jgi:hypothetical protein
MRAIYSVKYSLAYFEGRDEAARMKDYYRSGEYRSTRHIDMA